MYHRRLFPGVLIQGNKIWLSEVVGMLLLLVLLLVFGWIMVSIIGNSIAVNRLDETIRQLRSDQIVLDHRRQRLRTEAFLVEILDRISGHRLPDSTVGTLVAHVYRHSRRFGYDPLLVFAVIQTESMFDAEALGRFRSGRMSGALGLMQLKYPTALEVAADLGVTLTSPRDLFKPEINIPLGVAYLTRQVTRFNSFKLGLLAYNQGPGTIQNTLKARQPLSIGYYNKVLDHYYRFQSVRKSMQFELSDGRD